MSKREELQSANDKFKNSLESQLDGIKHDFDRIGRNALIVGGGLLGAYLLANSFTGSKKKEKKRNKQKREKSSKSVVHKENLLTSTVKEQAIVFLLGLATERLSAFLKEIDADEKK